MPPLQNNRTWLRHLLLARDLALVVIIEITHRIREGEFNLNFDEPHPAFAGLFFRRAATAHAFQ